MSHAQNLGRMPFGAAIGPATEIDLDDDELVNALLQVEDSIGGLTIQQHPSVFDATNVFYSPLSLAEVDAALFSGRIVDWNQLPTPRRNLFGSISIGRLPDERPSSLTVAALRQEIVALKERVAALEAEVVPEDEGVDEPDWAEALSVARAFFDAHKGERVLPTDLAAEIGTSVMTAVDLCEALAAEGVIVETE